MKFEHINDIIYIIVFLCFDPILIIIKYNINAYNYVGDQ